MPTIIVAGVGLCELLVSISSIPLRATTKKAPLGAFFAFGPFGRHDSVRDIWPAAQCNHLHATQNLSLGTPPALSLCFSQSYRCWRGRIQPDLVGAAGHGNARSVDRNPSERREQRLGSLAMAGHGHRAHLRPDCGPHPPRLLNSDWGRCTSDIPVQESMILELPIWEEIHKGQK